MKQVLKVCRQKDRLNPKKFAMSHSVVFGGVNIEGLKMSGDDERRVYIRLTDECLQDFLKIERPKGRKDIQRIVGLTNQLNKW